ncbi:MAG: hypothetical protein ACYC2H_10670 [Thermoplasmatota archaeon]
MDDASPIPHAPLAYYYDAICKARGHGHGVDGITDCMLDQFALLRVQDRNLQDRLAGGQPK